MKIRPPSGSVLGGSQHSTIKIHAVYPSDESFIDTDVKEVFRSGSAVVKLWGQVAREGLGPSLYHFLTRVSALAAASPEYLPAIKEYGISTRSSQLYLITEHVTGISWANAIGAISDDGDKFTLIQRLVNAVEHLHAIGYSHGDLNPSNVMVITGESGYHVKLIDIPDFRADGSDAKSPRYSPLNIDHCSPVERDNYAVMRMAIELLGMDWDSEEAGRFPEIREALNVERTTAGSYLYLSRFKEALEAAAHPKGEQSSVAISLRQVNGQQAFQILPENGRLYVSLEADKKAPTEKIVVTFAGVGGALRLLYSVTERAFVVVLSARESDRVRGDVADSADLEINLRINIKVGVANSLEPISRKFATNAEFQDLVKQLVRPAERPILTLTKSAVSAVPADANAPDVADVSDAGLAVPAPKPKISTGRLWGSIMRAEAEARPEIEVASEPVLSQNREELIIQCRGSEDVLDEFNADDQVFLTRIQKDGKEQDLGQINIKSSRSNEIRLVPRIGRSLQVGERLVLTTREDTSSYVRRKSAVDRILDRRSVVSNLIEYFDADSAVEPAAMGIGPSEEELSKYTRTNEHGQRISLNEAQRQAFDRLLRYGPVSLLQGPPGTGKTEFIAAFVHHLVATSKAKSILLVSQSHEAVNTAAERIRSHCGRLGTSLDVVRFSNRDKTISAGLQDVYSKSIVREKRELFRAEETRRVAALQASLGVPDAYLRELLVAERQVGSLVKRIHRIGLDIASSDDPELRVELESSREELISDLKGVLARDYAQALEDDGDFNAVVASVWASLSRKHGIAPHEERRCRQLFKLMADYYDRLANERSNYDEFLARSRTLVCGTCVGIGLAHLGIAANVYDWVIIDEAARATPGELSIAMQAGKRVLLVGDHRQLPPLYKDKHKDVIGREFGLLRGDSRLDAILVSDFERVFESSYGRIAGATLRTQYRMQPPIGDLVSNVFYRDSRLENGERPIPPCFARAPNNLSSTVTWLDTSPLGDQSFHESVAGSNSLRNVAECNRVIEILREIEADREFLAGLAASVKDDEPAIGVICMYAEQAKLISRKFSEVVWTEEMRSLVKIDTVDGYQGKENRIVIVSLTRSDRDRTPGFLRLPNRINVAMSRAMDRLVILGNIKMWEEANTDMPLGRVASFIRERSSAADYRIVSPAGSGVANS